MKLMNVLLNRKIIVSLFSVLVIIFGVLGANRLDRELLQKPVEESPLL